MSLLLMLIVMFFIATLIGTFIFSARYDKLYQVKNNFVQRISHIVHVVENINVLRLQSFYVDVLEPVSSWVQAFSGLDDELEMLIDDLKEHSYVSHQFDDEVRELSLVKESLTKNQNFALRIYRFYVDNSELHFDSSKRFYLVKMDAHLPEEYSKGVESYLNRRHNIFRNLAGANEGISSIVDAELRQMKRLFFLLFWLLSFLLIYCHFTCVEAYGFITSKSFCQRQILQGR
ncbi:hypothetical protein [uncultured Vibrio sp.]|nr:hypothetical protein [uncultured Vibrio sp.]